MLEPLFRSDWNSEQSTPYYWILLFSWILWEALSFWYKLGNVMRFSEMNSPGRQPKVFYGKRQFWQSDKYLWLSEEKGLCDSQKKVLFYSITFSVIVYFWMIITCKQWCSITTFLGLCLVFKVDESAVYCLCLLSAPLRLAHQEIVTSWHL